MDVCPRCYFLPSMFNSPKFLHWQEISQVSNLPHTFYALKYLSSMVKCTAVTVFTDVFSLYTAVIKEYLAKQQIILDVQTQLYCLKFSFKLANFSRSYSRKQWGHFRWTLHCSTGLFNGTCMKSINGTVLLCRTYTRGILVKPSSGHIIVRVKDFLLDFLLAILLLWQWIRLL